MKKSKILIFILAFVIFIYSTIYSQAAFIYGEKHFFSVLTPEDWIFDRDFAHQVGLPYIIYPSSEKDNQTKKIYIYARGADRQDDSKANIHTFINDDTNYFLSQFQGLKIKKQNIKFTNITKNNFLSGKYYVYKFIHPDGRYESVAYIDANETVVTIVFSAYGIKNYNKYFKDFIYVVNSFTFLNNNMKIIQK